MRKVLLFLWWFVVMSGADAFAQELTWPKDPFARDYKVDAAYGARIAEGSFFHKGLDLNGVGGGDTDLNYPLIAEEYGTIFGIGMTNSGVKWIGINYGNHRTFAYLHIFPDNNEDSTGNFVAGTFTRLTKDQEVQSCRRIQTGGNKDRGIILFYSGEDNTGRIVKALGISGVHNNVVQVPDNTDVQIAAVGTIVAAANSPIVCPDTSLTGSGALETSIRDDDVYDSVSGCILAGPNKRADSGAGFVVPQVYVNSGEIIAPLGRSGLIPSEYAHLHLQISNPDPILHNERDPKIIAPTSSVLFNKLPLAVSAGIAFMPVQGFMLNFDAKRYVYDKYTTYSLGTEYALFGGPGTMTGLSLRGGVNGGAGQGAAGAFSAGAGIKVLNAELDYAMSPEGAIGGTQRITLKKKF